MMKVSPWPNKKAMGFPPMAFEFFSVQNLLRRGRRGKIIMPSIMPRRINLRKDSDLGIS